MSDSKSPSGESPALWFALGAAAALTPTLLHSLTYFFSKSPSPTEPQTGSKCPFSTDLVKRGSDGMELPPTAANVGCPYLASLDQPTPAIDMAKFYHSKHQSGGPGGEKHKQQGLMRTSSATLERASSSTSSSTSFPNTNKPKKGKDPVHYHSYLDLDNILGAQKPISWQEGGTHAHDEHLFIITHQASELWFKQLLHDLISIIDIMNASYISENSMATVLERLTRICKIQNLLIEHLHVLQTMTPLSFLDFRDYLYPASGFQSMQFRQVECLLGLTRDQRLTYAGSDYDTVLLPEQQKEMRELEKTIPTLFVLIDKWLTRTPLLNTDDGYNFWEQYQHSVKLMLDEQEEAIKQQYHIENSISKQRYDAEVMNIVSQRDFFTTFFNEKQYNDLVHSSFGPKATVLSYKAVQAATMINVYQHLTLFSPAFQLLTMLQEVDSNFARWRSAHASMVLRMIGGKMGTGGSSGWGYLNDTINRHRIFKQLSDLSSLVIPRPYLPILPDHVIRSSSFFPEDFRNGEQSNSNDIGESLIALSEGQGVFNVAGILTHNPNVYNNDDNNTIAPDIQTSHNNSNNSDLIEIDLAEHMDNDVIKHSYSASSSNNEVVSGAKDVNNESFSSNIASGPVPTKPDSHLDTISTVDTVLVSPDNQ